MASKKANMFGFPFYLVPADDEVEHLRAVMANVQSYIDHPDTEAVQKSELQGAMEKLKESLTLLTSAMSPAPRV